MFTTVAQSNNVLSQHKTTLGRGVASVSGLEKNAIRKPASRPVERTGAGRSFFAALLKSLAACIA